LTADSAQATGLKWATISGLTVFNVKDYGAVGDADTDDQPAIQAAIDDAEVGGIYGGGIVYLPPGTYRLNSTLLVKESNVTLQGAGIKATRLVILAAAATYPAITFTGYKDGVAATPSDASTFPQYFAVRDMLIEKAYPVVNEAPGISLYCNLVTRIQDVQINSFGTGILVSASRNVYADRVFTQAGGGDEVSNMYGWKFDSNYGNFSSYLSNCISSFGGTNTDPNAGTVPTTYGFYNAGYEGTDWLLTSCEVNAATYGFFWTGGTSTVWATGFDLHFVMCIADQCQYGFKIDDNLHVSAVGGQVDLDSCYYANRWTDVVPTPQRIGVWVNTCSGVTIRGLMSWVGHPTDTTHYQNNTSIYVEGSRDVSITACNLKGNALQGIYLNSTKFATVVGNTILQTHSLNGGTLSRGIIVAACTQISVSGNTIRSVTGLSNPMNKGIHSLTTSSGIALTGNVVDTATVTSPLVVEAGSSTANSNNVGF
jgi:parallel beta-helix repeat protein